VAGGDAAVAFEAADAALDGVAFTSVSYAVVMVSGRLRAL